MRKIARVFSQSQLGATAIEYGLIAGILSDRDHRWIEMDGKSALNDTFSAVSKASIGKQIDN